MSQAATKSDTAAEIGKSQNESRDQVFHRIRLTYLIFELLDKINEGGIALSPAVEPSYLSKKQQKILLDAMSLNDCTPFHAQSIRMKKQAYQNTLSSDGIYEIMSEEKGNQTERISFKVQDLKGFFPKNFTQKQMTDTILKLLYEYNRKLERSRRSGIMKKLGTFTVNPNVVYMLPHEPIDENEKINLSQEVVPCCPHREN